MSTQVDGMTVSRFQFYSWKFWRAFAIHMRPYLLFVSGIAGVSGIAIGLQEGHRPLETIAVFIPLFLGYGFGQALTDCFQTDTDKLSSPYRPLSMGTLSIRSVLIISLTGLIAIAVILYLFNPISLWLSILAVLGLATYSFVKKHFWYGGPIHNSWIIALIPVIGYYAISGSSADGFPVRYIPNVVITFFSYASFVLIGYLKDIEADRATGYKTFPVVFGWDLTMLLGDGIALVTLVLLWVQWPKNTEEIAFGLAGSMILIFGQYRGHVSREKNEKAALVPILATVRSFILIHISLVLHQQSHWWWLMALYYVLFEVTLYARPSRYQV